MKKIFAVLLLLLVGGALAQTSFIQNRFLGMPNILADTCDNCTPDVDGVLEYRLSSPTIGGNNAVTTATFHVSIRVRGGDAETKERTRLAIASVRLAYNEEAFGENVVQNGKCTAELNDELFAGYEENLLDSNADPDSAFTFTATTLSQVIAINDNELQPDRFVKLTDNFQEFVTITCEATDINEEIDIGISGTDISANMIYVYDDVDSPTVAGSMPRSIFPSAYNDLRGYRLDDKIYATDYIRYSNGRGVIVTFSDVITPALTASDFVLDPPNSTYTISVTHTAGEDEAIITFSGGTTPPTDTELKFADTLSNTQLASDSFIAALEYDTAAPRATAITPVSSSGRESTWSIQFNAELDPNTVNANNLCLTETPGVCPDEPLSVAGITSASIDSSDTTTRTITILIDANDRSQSRDLSIAFERNAVRSEDQRPAEEYQPVLVNAVRIEENNAPVINLSRNNVPLLDAGNGSEEEVRVTVSDDDVGDEIEIELKIEGGLDELVTISPTTATIAGDGNSNTQRAAQTFTLSAMDSQLGNTTVTVVVSDGTTDVEDSIRVSVAENVAPVISGLAARTIELNTSETISFTVRDDNADINNVEAEETGGGSLLNIGTVMGAGGTYTVEIQGTMTGDTMMLVTATDSAGNTDMQTVQVTVTMNAVPTIELVPKEVTLLDAGDGSEIDVSVTVSDADVGDEIMIELRIESELDKLVTISPTTATIAGDGSNIRRAMETFTLTAIEGDSGATTVTVVVDDGKVEVEDNIRVSVVENVAPVISDLTAAQTIALNTSETISFMVSDTNRDITRVDVTEETEDESLLSIGEVMEGDSSGEYTVEIRGTGLGQTTMTVKATDSANNMSIQTVEVTVNAVPTIELVPNEVTLLDAGERTTATVAVTVSDVDVGDDITIELTDANGVVSIEPAGTITVAGGADAQRAAQTFTLTALQAGDTTVIVMVSDGNASATEEIEVSVAENVAPVISGLAAAQTIALNTSETISFMVSDTNRDITNVDVTEETEDESLLSIGEVMEGDSSGEYTVEIRGTGLGQTTMTVKATDSANNMSIQTVEVTVEENAPPTIELVPEMVSLLDDGERTSATVAVTVSDADVGDDITIELTDANGVVSIEPAGTITVAGGTDAQRSAQTFTLTALQAGDTTVIVMVSDGNASATEEIEVSVAENVAPVISGLAAAQTIALNTSETISFMVSDTNRDITNVDVTEETEDESLLSIGEVMEGDSSGEYTVEIRGTGLGQTTMTVKATDSANNMSIQTVEVTVEENAPPTIELVPEMVSLLDAGERTTATVAVTVSDADVGDDITIELTDANGVVSIEPAGTITVAGGTDAQRSAQTFILTAEQAGDTMVRVTVSDGEASTTDNIVVSVAENVAPVISGLAARTIELNTSETISFTVSDDNEDITGVAVEETGGENLLSIAPVIPVGAGGYNVDIRGTALGQTTMTVTATDSAANTHVQTVQVTVEENTPPTIVLMPDAVELLDDGEMTSATVTVTVSDDDVEDTIMISLMIEDGFDNLVTISPRTATIAGDGNGDAQRAVQTFTLEAIENESGNTTVAVVVSDGKAEVKGNITVSVVENVAPVISEIGRQTILLNVSETISFVVLDDNEDITGVTVEETGGENLLSIASVTPVGAGGYNVDIRGTALGQTTMTVTATDSADNMSTQTVSVTVNAVPTIELVPNMVELLDAGERTTATVTVTVSDDDVGDDITIALMDENGVVGIEPPTITIAGGVNIVRAAQTFILTAQQAGNTTVRVTVSDGEASTTDNIVVSVAENVAPVISGLAAQTIELNTAETISFTVMDDNGDISNVEVAETGGSLLSIGTVMEGASSGDYTVSITGTMAGQTTITVTATDSAGNTDVQTVQVTVEENAPPTIMLDPNMVELLDSGDGSEAVVRVTVSDDDVEDDITIQLMIKDGLDNLVTISPTDRMISGDGNSVAQRAMQTFSLAAVEGMSGNTTVTVVVDDGKVEVTDSITVSVDENVAPVISGLAARTITLNTSETISFTVRDDNADITSVEAEETGGESLLSIGEVMEGDSSGEYTVEIQGTMLGQTAIIVTATDSADNMSTQTVSVTVNAVPTIELVPNMVELLDDGDRSEVVVRVTVSDEDVEDKIDIELKIEGGLDELVTISPTTATIAGDPVGSARRATQNFGLAAVEGMSGNTTVTVVVSDGKVEVRDSITVSVDENVAPVISGLAARTITLNTSETISFTVSDDNQDISNVDVTEETEGESLLSIGEVMEGDSSGEYTVEIQGTMLGETMIMVTATDSADNMSTQTVSVTVNAVPTIELVPNMVELLDDGDRSEVVVRVTVSDEDVEDKIDIELKIEGGLDELVTISPTTATIAGDPVGSARRATQNFGLAAVEGMSGNTTVTVVVTDGKVEVRDSITVSVDENVAPVISVLRAQTITLNTSDTISFTVSDDNQDISNVDVTEETEGESLLSIGEVMEGDSSGEYIVEIQGTGLGQTTMTVKATDSAGNTDVETVRVTVGENAIPRIMLSSNMVSLLDAGERTTAAVTVTVSDEDVEDDITIEWIGIGAVSIGPARRITIAGGTDAQRAPQTFILTAERVGDIAFEVWASDGKITARARVAVSVAENVDPVISEIDAQTIKINTAETISFTVSDANEDITDVAVVETGGANLLTIGEATEGDSSGAYTVEIQGTGLGQTTMTVTATDSAGNTDMQTVRVTVRENAAPEIALEPRMVSLLDVGERTTATVTVTVSDEDVGDDITIELTDANSFVSIEPAETITISGNSDGDVARTAQTFILTAEQVGNTMVVVTVSDGEASPTANIDVSVAENVAPVISEIDAQTITLNTSETISFMVSDDNEDISNVEVEETGGGSLLSIGEVMGDSGTYTVEIQGTMLGQTAIIVTATDSADNMSTQTVSVTVNAEPTIELVPNMVELLDAGERSEVEVDVTVSDADVGDTITIQLMIESELEDLVTISPQSSTIAADGSVRRATETFSLTAVEGMSGNTTVTVVVDDGKAEVKGSIVVSVDENVAPVISGLAAQTITLNTSETISFMVSDDNEDISSVEVEETGGGSLLSIGEVMGDSGTYTVEIQGTMLGETAIIVTATDSADNMSTQTVSVTVNAVPTITLDSDMVELLDSGDGSEAVVSVTVSDDDVEDDITIQLMIEDGLDDLVTITPSERMISGSPGGDVQRAVQTFTLTAVEDMLGNTTVTVVVLDGKVEVEDSITVSVDENVAPVITDLEAQTITLDVEETISFTVSDENGDISSVEVEETGGASLLTIGSATGDAAGVYTVNIEGTMVGDTMILVTATDSAGNMSTQTAPVTVNALPEITIDPDMVSLLDAGAGSTATVSVTVSDANVEDDITITLNDANGVVSIDPAGTITISGDSGGNVARTAQTFTLMALQAGDTTVTVTVGDGEASVEDNIAVSVVENVAPVISGLMAQTIMPNTSETISFTVSDANGDITSVVATETGGGNLLTIGTATEGDEGSYTVNIEGTATGQTMLTVTATDSAGNTDVQEVGVTVSDNALPEITLEPKMVSLLDAGRGSTATVSVTVSDADVEDDITITLNDANGVVSIDPAGTITISGDSGGNVARTAQTFTLTALQAGDTTVTVTVGDGEASVEDNIAVSVVENVAPVISAIDAQTIRVNTAETISFMVSDANEDITGVVATETGGANLLTISAATEGEAGSYTVDITGTAIGQTAMTVTATDSAGNTDMQTVQVTVNAVPTIELMPEMVSLLAAGERTTATVTVTVSDADVADDITIQLMIKDGLDNLVTITPSESMISGSPVGDVQRAVQTFSLTAVEGMSGNTTVTVVVDDGKTEVEGNIKVSVAENVAPVISGLAAQTITLNTSETISFTVSDDNGDISSVEVEETGGGSLLSIGEVMEGDSSGEYTVEIQGTMLGQTAIIVTATDSADNMSTQTVSVTVNAVPTIELVPNMVELLDDGDRSEVVVRVTVSDEDVEDKIDIELKIEGGLDELVTISPTTATIAGDPVGSARRATQNFGLAAVEGMSGNTTVTVVVTDGKVEVRDSITVSVDENVAPVISGLAAQTITLNTSDTISFTVSDDNQDISNVEAEETGNANLLSIGEVMEDGGTYTVEIQGTMLGETMIMVTATDSADNMSTQTVSVTVNAVPTIELVPNMVELLDDGDRSEVVVRVTVSDEDVEDKIDIELKIEGGLDELVTISPTTATIAGDPVGSARRATQNFGLAAVEGMSGNTTVTVVVTDGKVEVRDSITVSVDENVAPVISGLAAQQTITLNTSDTISFTVSDDNQDISNVEAEETGNANLLSIGEVMEGDSSGAYIVEIQGTGLGQTTMTVKATDSAGNTDEQTVRVTVGENALPMITLVPNMISLLDAGERTTAAVTVTVSDEDVEDDITITLSDANGVVSIEPAGTITIDGGTDAQRAAQTFILTAEQIGDTTVVVTVEDVEIEVTAEIAVSVAENIDPVISEIDAQTIKINTAETISFTVSDANEDITDVAVVETGGANLLTIGEATEGDSSGAYTVEIQGTGLGQTTMTVTATDSAGNTDVQTVQVTVRENAAPEIALEPRMVSLLDAGERTTATVTVTVSDEDVGDDITIELTDANSFVSIEPAGTITIDGDADVMRAAQTFILTAEQVGNTMVMVTVSDGEASATANIDVSVAENVAPVISEIDAQTITLNTSETISFMVSDDNEDISNVEVEETGGGSLLSIGEVMGDSGTYTVEIQGTMLGETAIIVTATDSADNMSTQTVSVTVNAVPTIELVPNMVELLDAGERSEVEVDVTVSDDDVEDDITIQLMVEDGLDELVTISPSERIISGSSVGDVQRAVQTFSLTAVEGMSGNTTVTVVVDDGKAEVKGSIVVSVDENVAPVISGLAAQTITLNTSETISFMVSDDNEDISSVDVEETGGESILSIGEVMGDGGTYTVEIQGTMLGETMIIVTATDSAGNTSTQTESVTVNAVPMITLDRDMVLLSDSGDGSEAEIDVTVSDADVGDDITIQLMIEDGLDDLVTITPSERMISGSPGGDVQRAVQTFTLTAVEDMLGNTTVTVVVLDGKVEVEDSITVSVDENVAPVITDLEAQTITLDVEETISFTVSDENGDISSVEVEETGGASLLTIGSATGDAAGVYTVNIEGTMVGDTMILVTATDSAGNMSTQTAPVTVNALPEITIDPDMVSLLDAGAGSTATVSVTVSDANVEDDITITLNDANGVVSIDPAGTITISGDSGGNVARTAQTFTLMALQAGDTTVTVTVGDGEASVEDNIAVSVVENVAPVISGLMAQTIMPNTSETISFTVSDANGDITSVVATETGGGNLLTIGTATEGDEGSYTVNIEGTATGQTMLTVTATDSAGNTDVQEVGVTVSDNALPEITLEPKMVSLLDAGRGNTATVSVTVSDADVEDDITITLNDANGVVSIDPAGTITISGDSGGNVARTAQTFTLTALQAGDTTVTVTVGDGEASVEDNIAVSVVENVAPVISAIDAQTIRVNTAETISFMVSDANEDITGVVATETGGANLLTISAATESEAGSYTVDITGTAIGQTTMTVTATDSAGNTDMQTVQVTVSENASPTIELVPEMVSLLDEGERTTTTVTVTVSDDDVGDDITIELTDANSVVSIEPAGTITVAGGADAQRTAQTFTLTALQAGDTTVLVTVSDGTASATDNIAVSVAENVAPVISAIEAQMIKVNTTETISFMVSDTNDDISNVAVEETDSGSLLSIGEVMEGDSSGTYTVEIQGTIVGETMIMVTATDSAENTATQTVQVEVRENASPTIELEPEMVLLLDAGERTTATVDVTVSDADVGDSITIELTDTNSVVSIEPVGTITVAGGADAQRTAQTFTLTALQAGDTTVLVTVSDGEASTTDNIVVSVAENVAPVISAIDAQTIALNTSETISFTVSDANEDITDVAVVETGGANLLTIGAATEGDSSGAYTVEIQGTGLGQTTMTVTATDSANNTDMQTVRVTVRENAPPTIELMPGMVSLLDAGERTTATVTVTVSDADAGDTITIELTDANGFVSIEPAGTITVDGGTDVTRAAQTFTLTAMQAGDTMVLVTVSDGEASATANIDVSVVENVAPVISDLEAQTITLNTSETISFMVSDDNEDIRTVEAEETGGESLLSIGDVIGGDSGAYTVEIQGTGLGQTTMTVTATDSAGNTDMQTVAVTVGENALPRITLSSNMVSLLDDGERTTATVDVTVSDADVGDDITIELTDANGVVSIEPAGTVTVAGGADAQRAAQTFTLTALQAGDTTVIVMVSDGNASATAEIEVSVAENVAPAISGLTAQTIKLNTAETISFTVMDDNEDISRVDVEEMDGSSLLSIGEVMGDGGTYTVEIQGTGLGDTAIIVKATDSAENISTQTVQVTVRENAAPEIELEPEMVLLLDAGERTTATVDVTVSDADVGDDITIELTDANSFVSIEPAGAITIDGDADVMRAAQTFILTAQNAGNTMVLVTVSDGEASTTDNITVSVAENVAPVISDLEAQTIVLNTSETISFMVSDVNDDISSVEVEETGGESLLSIGEVMGDRGTYTVEIQGTMLGETMMLVTATDSAGNTSTQTESVTVNAVPTIELMPNMVELLDAGERTTATVDVTVSDDDVEDDITIQLTIEDGLDELVTISPSERMISGSSGGDVQRAVQTFSLTAVEGMSGNTTVTVVVDDGKAEVKGSIIVSVDENVAPVISGLAAQTITLNTSETISFMVSDENADISSVDVEETGGESLLSIGEVMGDGGTYTVEIQGTMLGETMIIVTATDSAGNTSTQTESVTVNAVPMITLDRDMVLLSDSGDGSEAEIDVTVSDADVGDDITIRLMIEDGLDNLVTITPSDSMIAGDVNGDAERAVQTFTLAAMEGELGNTTVTVVVGDGKVEVEDSITVSVDENVAPVISGLAAQTITLNTSETISFMVSDDNEDISNVEVEETGGGSLLSIGEVMGDSGTYTVEIQGTMLGETAIIVTATDSADNMSTQTVSVTVNAVPTITLDSDMVELLDSGDGSEAVVSVTVSDDDVEDDITIQLMIEDGLDDLVTITPSERMISGSPGGDVQRAVQTFTLTAVEDMLGNTTVTVVVLDGKVEVEDSITVSVVENVAPVISGLAAQTIVANTSETISFMVSDANGDITSVVATETGGGNLLTIGTATEGDEGSYTVNIEGTATGQTMLTVTATDSANNISPQTVQVTVEEAPQGIFIRTRVFLEGPLRK